MVDQADCVLVFGAGLNLLTMSFGHSLPTVPLIQVDTHARPHRPLASGRRRRGRRCEAGGRGAARGAAARLQCRAAVPLGRGAGLPGGLRHRPRLRAGQHGAHGRSAGARRGAGDAAAGPAQPGLRRRQLPRHRALPVGAGSRPFQADQRLRLDRAGLRHGARRRAGAARRDHRAGDRRRRLPDDHGRARDRGARGPAAGHRADERLRLRGRAALPQDARPAGRQVGVPRRRLCAGRRGVRLPGAHHPHARRAAKAAPLLAKPDGPLSSTASSTPQSRRRS